MKAAIVTIWSVVLVLALTLTFLTFWNPFSKETSATGTENELQISTSPVQINENLCTVSITVAGDCTFGTDPSSPSGSSFDSVFEKNGENYYYFMENVEQIFKSDDLTIINFEGVLTENGDRAIKEYAFKGRPEYVNILSVSSIEAVNLANNHTLDFGEQGLKQTHEIMSDNGVIAFGGSEYAIETINGIKVGLVGTNALNYAGRTKFPDVIKKLKEENVDLIVASFHWGEEKATAADYVQTDLAHQAIDLGADLVVGHHPHVIQGIEKYKGKYIVYSLGNFCFGGNTNPNDKDTMIFNQVFTFDDKKLMETEENVSVIPCSVSSVSSHNDFKPTPLKGDEFKRVKQKIIDRSYGDESIQNIDFIKAY